MSRDMDANEAPIASIDDLRSPFVAGSKGAARRGVGTEHEKLGYRASDLAPLPYEGEDGIGALLEALVSRGWSPLFDGGRVLALERDGGAITLEPGGQFELSGRVTRTIHETRDELLAHLREVRDVGHELGQVWTHHAIQPVLDLEGVPWMPKSRYGVMRAYLPTRGSRAWWMMKMTCTVQANFDYRDEADAMDMLRLGAEIGPVVTAIFAASPVRLGAPTGWQTNRMWAWEDTDPDRCGVPDAFFAPDPSFDHYVEYLLDVPMFFVRRDDRYVDVSGRSFRELLEGRVEGLQATQGDWELHMSTAFPDIRMKRYIETRTTDAGPPDLLLALPALWKGIFYDDTARELAREIARVTTAADARSFAHEAAVRGLDGHWQGHAISSLADQLIHVARAGLDRQAARDGHASEARWLDTLHRPDGSLRKRAEEVMRAFEAAQGDLLAFHRSASIEDGVAWLESTVDSAAGAVATMP